jgi:hypothetical protein
MVTVAALYVATGGAYFGLEGVDPWDEPRDARGYDGPHPVVAHPPCTRWSRFWSGGPSAKVRRVKGDDGGCFAHAFACVNLYGGVLEHPEASHAWDHFGITIPPRSGGWVRHDPHYEQPAGRAWTCCVSQGKYGHRAQKLTWLFYVGHAPPPSMLWGLTPGRDRLDEGFHSAAERKAARAAGVKPRKRLSTAENLATPVPFRDLLLSIARSAVRP